ncbi:MAG: response regulator [Chitinophagaceae bacterium]|nr:response regulator [Chitinophagaceae bacterium]
MAKIMVVDDEADLEMLIKQKFRQKIREKEYEFVFAGNGRLALEKLAEQQDIELILSDINMPEMDGLTLLQKVSEQNSLLRTIIISAYGDMQNIRAAMNLGAYDFVTKPIDFTDLEVTVAKTLKDVQQMKETLEAVRENNILKMYVDQNVLNFMGSKEFEKSLAANETIEGTVVFVDICGFTSISESEKPDNVVKLLNDYFEIIVKQIIGQKGHIDKFIGDAVMAVFRGEYHLDRALDACLATVAEIEKCLPFTGNTTFKPHVAIGINSGEMISGNIGSTSLRRLDYTVIGDTVNTAQRLQSIAGPGEIIINKNSYEKIKEFFQCESKGTVSLKHKSLPEEIYRVVK